jgi:hypothetical protein
MSDIHSIQPAGGAGSLEPGKVGKNDKSVNGPAFSDILDQTSRADKSGQVGGVQAAASPHPATYIGKVESAPGAKESVQRVSEEFFKIMESFQTELGSPESSMKDIEPLVRHMESFQSKLTEEANVLPQNDPGRGLLEEMAVMVSSESAKFQRGEYI